MEIAIFKVLCAVFLAMTALSIKTSALVLPKNSGKQLNAAPHPDGSRLPWDRAAGMKNPVLIWADAVLPYVISDQFSEDQVNLIKNAMDLITQKTCVTFPERTNEKDYLSIEPADRCGSFIGRHIGRQEIMLQTPGCGDYVGVVIHELLHALGLIHEHSRPDRDTYVEIVFKNIATNPAYAKSNFKRYSWQMVQNLTVPYDYTSVMHYPQYALSENGNRTIIPKGNGTIPDQFNDLSAGDVTFINFMYCNTTTP